VSVSLAPRVSPLSEKPCWVRGAARGGVRGGGEIAPAEKQSGPRLDQSKLPENLPVPGFAPLYENILGEWSALYQENCHLPSSPLRTSYCPGT
jgi:hypothetical protein